MKAAGSVLKLSQVKFFKDLGLCFLHTCHIEYGCMCRKFKKVGESQTAKNHIFYDLARIRSSQESF
jgi:hypothetical protein